MSTFLQYKTNFFAAATPAGTIQSTIDGYLMAQGWQRVTYDSVGFISDFVPPASEAVGDGKVRQVTRITYSITAINIGMYDQAIANVQGQMYRLYSATAGAVTITVTINGTVVTVTGTAGYTSAQNTRVLYNALKSSVDSNVTDWNYSIVSSDTIIIMERKTISATVITITQTNITGATLSDPVTATYNPARNVGLATAGNGFVVPITLDNANGWYLYMDIFSRSFKLSAKTISLYYGPIYAYYMPNADALSIVPSSNYCHIAEGFWGASTAGTATVPTGSVSVYCTHGWAFTNGFYYSTGAWNNGFVNPMGGWEGPFIQDMISASPLAGTTLIPQIASPAGMGQPLASYDQLYVNSIYNVAFYPAIFRTYPVPWLAMDGVLPATLLEDVYISATTDSSETTCVAAMASPAGVTLNQALDATTAYTSVLLSTTTGLASSGVVILGLEVFLYTGLSGGNTITGVTRGYNGTPQAAHYIGDSALQGGWFVKMNGGCLFAGLTRPS